MDVTIELIRSRFPRTWVEDNLLWRSYVIFRSGASGSSDRYWLPPGLVDYPLRSANDLFQYLEVVESSDTLDYRGGHEKWRTGYWKRGVSG